MPQSWYPKYNFQQAEFLIKSKKTQLNFGINFYDILIYTGIICYFPAQKWSIK